MTAYFYSLFFISSSVLIISLCLCLYFLTNFLSSRHTLLTEGCSKSFSSSRPISGVDGVHHPISPKSKAAQADRLAGSIMVVPLFQLVPLRRKNKEGLTTSNTSGIHSRTCESDSEDTVQSLSPIKLIECRASPSITDRRPSDSSVKSIGSLGSKSRRKDNTPKSRPRLSLQAAALASECQSKLRLSSSHPVEGKSRISSSTEPDRRLVVPGTEAGGVGDRATPGSTFTARTSVINKDVKGKDRRKDREEEIKLGVEREKDKDKDSEQLRDLKIEKDRVIEKEKEMVMERVLDEERVREIEEENEEFEREEDCKRNKKEKEMETEEENSDRREEREEDSHRIGEVEEVAVTGVDTASGPSPDTGDNSSCRIINKASTSSSASTLATSSCSEKCVRDDKEPSVDELD